MGVFDRADEGSEEAKAYRAELAKENDRLAAKVAPVLLVLIGIVATWGAISTGTRLLREYGEPVRCEGRLMEPADTCWAVLTKGASTFELFAPAAAGPVSDTEARRIAVSRGSDTAPYPYDYTRTRSIRKNEVSNDGLATVVLGAAGAGAFLGAYFTRRGARRARDDSARTVCSA
ncbi:hypothetical protein [Tsukamurella hominis]|uniref:hypothetical protein n=1 Tax=Tsukamurella hominis TaxID=1970232 RepID=UPI0039EC9F93